MVMMLSIIGCDTNTSSNNEGSKTDKKEKKNGVVKTYHKDKSLSSECNYKEGLRHGLCRNYYPNGKVQTELNYVQGKKQGEGKMYYESGKIYLVSPYVDDEIHGLQKLYHENGNLMAEIPYANDELGMGLKEYSVSGKLKDQTPQIVITTKDNIKVNGEYIINLSVNGKGNYTNVQFYQGELVDGKYMNGGLANIPSPNNNVQFKLKLPPNTYVMQKFNFVAKVETPLKNYYIVQKSTNVAVENR